ncbi:uncharacterized protein LOC114722574 [Neltuma alba]|uniref:uncharacterized protein LOC114722574 n=1 Tax=Neltuma alba TaxID=207710 RepID=UPI0010A4C6DD|nr:uncharacterized protein LOC114722574 [Prosopis alba]
MQTSRRQCSWRIFVRAQANNFNFTFRFRATSFGPNWTLHLFSFVLNFRKFFVFRLNSHRPPPIAPRPSLGLIRHRVLDVIQKFRSRITARNRAASRNRGWMDEQQKDLILAGFCLLLAFSVQHKHMWKKYGKGVLIIMLVSVGFMGVLLMKKGKKAKPVKVSGLCNGAAILAACSLLFMLGIYWDGIGIIHVANQVWEWIS